METTSKKVPLEAFDRIKYIEGAPEPPKDLNFSLTRCMLAADLMKQLIRQIGLSPAERLIVSRSMSWAYAQVLREDEKTVPHLEYLDIVFPQVFEAIDKAAQEVEREREQQPPTPPQEG